MPSSSFSRPALALAFSLLTLAGSARAAGSFFVGTVRYSRLAEVREAGEIRFMSVYGDILDRYQMQVILETSDPEAAQGLGLDPLGAFRAEVSWTREERVPVALILEDWEAVASHVARAAFAGDQVADGVAWAGGFSEDWMEYSFGLAPDALAPVMSSPRIRPKARGFRVTLELELFRKDPDTGEEARCAFHRVTSPEYLVE